MDRLGIMCYDDEPEGDNFGERVVEVQRVLSNLGFKDGFGLDKCKRMIEAVDANGDGDGGFLKLTANFDVSS
ncbi:hypothetical protein CerSpe_021950 [Prunus speciosa]